MALLAVRPHDQYQVTWVLPPEYTQPDLQFLWIFIFLDYLLIYETPVWSSNSQSLASKHFPAPVIASWICWPLRLEWFTQGFCCRLKTFELYHFSTFLSAASLMMILFHISSVECSRIEKLPLRLFLLWLLTISGSFCCLSHCIQS